MSQLAFWPAPRNEDAVRIKVQRSPVPGVLAVWSDVIALEALDNYDNWVTHYLDEEGTTGDFYRAIYLDTDGNGLQTTLPEAGQTPYAVTPQMVIDTIQGLPLNSVAALMVQLRIKWAVAWAEDQIRQNLSATTATREPYTYKAFRAVIGSQSGRRLQLRNFPVDPDSAITIEYRIRTGGTPSTFSTLNGLDIVVEDHNPASGYNHGVITAYPTYTSFANLFAGHLGNIIAPHDISVFISYTYGYTTWPDAIAKMVTEIAAADVMEIAGEAETAGLSSRSIDGYSESYTASATTTVFSARRIMYADQAKEIIKLHRKPLWG